MITVIGSVRKDAGTVEPDPMIDPDTGSVQPVGQAGWTLAMSEEFNGTPTISDPTLGYVQFRPGGPQWATWYPDWPRFDSQSPGGNHTNTDEAAYYQTGMVSTGSGSLRLTMDKTATGGLPYRGGMIQSLPSFTPLYGFFEARLRLDHVDTGVWAAWWMSCSDYNAWPPEIDVAEVYDAGTGILSNIFVPSVANYSQKIGESSAGLAFHTYGCEWSPAGVAFYLDGVQVAGRTTNVPATHQYLILNHGARLPANPTWQSGLMEVDYVRAWR